MTRDELTRIVAGGESDRVEFKRSTGQRSEAMKTVCAFLNGLGGYVLFGVADNGALVGQVATARTLEEIANELRRIEPPAFPELLTVPVADNLSVIALVVNGGGGPYTYDGRPYLRIGPTTGAMPRERYEQLLLKRMHATRRWENQPAAGIGIDDLDPAELVRTVEEAIRRQRLEEPGTRDPVELLTASVCCIGGNCSMPGWCCSPEATGCCRIIPNAPCAWPVFAAMTRPNFSTTAKKPATPSTCSCEPSAFCAITCRWPGGSCRTCLSGSTTPFIPRQPCVKLWPTLSAIATTPSPEGL